MKRSSRKKRILLPAFTVAEWGGLHENVVHAARALIKRGHSVTLAVREGKIAEVGRLIGADVVPVDWHDWQATADEVASARCHDLIFAQPFKSREFGLRVAELTGVPFFVMFHGYAHDHVYLWEERAQRILVTARSLADFLVQYCKIPREKLWIVPNGVPQACFEIDRLPLEAKLSNGRGEVVLASRLAHDKRRQFEVVREIAPALEAARPDVEWEIGVYGDGPDRQFAEERLSAAVAGTRVKFDFRGWIDSQDVPVIMSKAVMTIGAGRGAMQSLAVGTPCVAAGARETVGLQSGSDLDAGVLSNFGDYAIGGYRPESIRAAVSEVLEPTRYSAVQAEGFARIESSLRQGAIDELIIEALGLDG